MLIEENVALINKYVDEKYFDREKLMKYLTLHELVGNEVFSYCDKKTGRNESSSYGRWLDDEYGYKPLPVTTFIRRIPFYFYVANYELSKVGSLSCILTGIIRVREEEMDLEEIFSILEFMFYEKGLQLDDIFNYIVDQTGFVSQNDVFMQWDHYLHLCDSLDINDPTPECFITKYNEVLEQSGLPPIIYEINAIGVGDYFLRTGSKMEFEGVIPCDKNGNPILKWIGLRVKSAGSITCTQKKSSLSHLFVELLPNTVIHALNCYNRNDDEGDEWYQLYAGPLIMEFDYEAMRSARKRLKYTQKQVAEAVGSSVRTYQKWENGETTPDGHYLLRILNWLDLPDVQYVTRYTE